MMNCEQFREVMQDLARDEGLDIEKTKDALAHADSCAECDALLEESESITSALSMLSLQHAAEEAPARVENALLHAFVTKHARAPRSMNFSVLSLSGIGSIAAAALLTIFLVRHTQPQVPMQTLQPPARATAPAQGGATASLESNPSTDPADEWLSAFGGNDSSDVATDETAAASFVPLSETFDPASLDDDTVVRVVVSRATLESFGLSLGGADDQVLADLIVTNDGTPQAIRVVGR